MVFKFSLKITHLRPTSITDKQVFERWGHKVQKLDNRVALKELGLPTGFNRVSLSSIIKFRVSLAWILVIATRSFCQAVLKLRSSKVKILQETSFTNRIIYHQNQPVENVQALVGVNRRGFKVSKVLQEVHPITSKTKRQYSLWVRRQ